PKAGNSRSDAETSSLPVLAESLIVPQWQWSRSHKAHVALYDIQQLRKFVDAGLPEQTSNGYHPWIIFYLKYRARGLVQHFKCRHHFVCVRHHCAEFIYEESSFVEPNPFLAKQYWTMGREFYR